MIGFIKRLWRDRRGNALIIVGAALPLLVGSAGLAVDTVQWAMWKRQLQRAADSAALAGVYAKVENNSGMTAAQAIDGDLAKHNTTGNALDSGFPNVAYPTSTAYTHGVQVTVAVTKSLGFSSMFLTQAPTITATGTAALFDDGSYCVVALAPTGPALNIGGSADVDLGCGAISNSTSADAVAVNGNAHNFEADPVAAAGGMPTSINGAGELQPYHIAMPDPYAGLSTAVPSGVTCTNSNHPSKTNADGEKLPGCYNNFNGSMVLSAGVYYLNSTSIQLTGHERIEGSGVTIILTGATPGTISMAGNSSMSITAPTTGTYANMLIMQAANAATGNANTINGDNNSIFDGAIYFPRGDLTFSGSSAAATQCAMIVAYTVEFTGNADIQNDTDDCVADTQVQGKKVRLIA